MGRMLIMNPGSWQVSNSYGFFAGRSRNRDMAASVDTLVLARQQLAFVPVSTD
jgi:hypothetical protein